MKAKTFTETLIPRPRQNGKADLLFVFQNKMISKDPTAGSRTSVKYLRWEDKC